MAPDLDPFAPDPDTVIWRFMENLQFDDLLAPFEEQGEWKAAPSLRGPRYTLYPGNLWFAYPSYVGDDLEGKMPDINANTELYLDRAARFLQLSPRDAAAFRERFEAS